VRLLPSFCKSYKGKKKVKNAISKVTRQDLVRDFLGKRGESVFTMRGMGLRDTREVVGGKGAVYAIGKTGHIPWSYTCAALL